MYKIDTCLRYMQCTNCEPVRTLQNLTGPRTQIPKLGHFGLHWRQPCVDPCPPGCHDVSSMHRGWYKPHHGQGAETGSKRYIAQLPRSVDGKHQVKVLRSHTVPLGRATPSTPALTAPPSPPPHTEPHSQKLLICLGT